MAYYFTPDEKEYVKKQGVSEDWAGQFLSNNPGDWERLGAAAESDRPREQEPEPSQGSQSSGDGGQGRGGPQWQSNPWADAYAASLAQQNQLMREMIESQRARDAENSRLAAERKIRADELYGTLLTRSQQATNVSPEDAIIKAQVDAYRAEQERGLRNFRSDAAENKQGLRPTQDRMAGERVAQGVASMQAELMARELGARRAEIADALSSMGGILGADQTVGLQRELAGIDNLIRQQQSMMGSRGLDIQMGDLGLRRDLGMGELDLGWGRLGVERELGMGGLSNDLLRTMLQNQQFYGDLGLRGRTQDDYYDLVRRGRLGNQF